MSRCLTILWCVFTIQVTVSFASCFGSSSEEWRIHLPFGDKERTEILEGLREEFAGQESEAWTILDGCPRVPSFPCTMASTGTRIFLATADRMEVFRTDSGTWSPTSFPLPAAVGPGTVMVSSGPDRLYLVRGGDSKDVWEITPSKNQIRVLPPMGVPVGRGAAITEWNGELYLGPGRKTEDFWVLREDAAAWTQIGRIGGEHSTLDTAFGRNCGFLATVDNHIYAWPNHHIHRFDAEAGEWYKGNWVAMNFLPVFDGGGVASAPGVPSIYAVAGFFSRSLNEISPNDKKAYFLKPRLPYPLIGEGGRLSIIRVGGVPHLAAYAVAPENKLCIIPLGDLERIHKYDTAADLGSSWQRFHTEGGGNGVRHWSTRTWKGVPGPTDESDRRGGTLGFMGALNGELFTMRRAYTRRINPETSEFSFYPGVNLGDYIGLGATGVFDGDKFTYFLRGKGDSFVRREVPEVIAPAPDAKDKLPVNETHMDVLSSTPEDVGRCASMAFADGSIYALRGGASRDFWRYDTTSDTWELLPSLPDEAIAIGEQGAGLVAAPGALVAVTGNQTWRFDLAAKAWTRLGQMDFAVDWDGGMVAGDGEGTMFVLRGGYSTRLAKVDLNTGAYTELFPRLPDAVSAEGNRLAVLTIEGEQRLYLHRGHNSNEILWIPVEKLGAK